MRRYSFLRKAISILVSASIIMTIGVIPTTAFVEASNENTLEIETSSISADVTSFAHKVFSSFTVDELKGIALSNNDVLNLRLGEGFQLAEIADNDASSFFFPMIASSGRIVSILNVISTDVGNYGWEVGHFTLAEALSNLSENESGVVKIFVSPNGYYAILADGTIKFLASDVKIVSAEDETQSEVVVNSVKSSLKTKSFVSEAHTIVSIAYDSAFVNDRLSSFGIAPTALVGLKVTVPYVPNSDKFDPNGACWASAIASIVAFGDGFINDARGTSAGVDIRDRILRDRYDKIGAYTGGTAQSVTYIKEYLDRNTKLAGKATWAETQKHISVADEGNNVRNHPFFSGWFPNDGGIGHALVVRGWVYDNQAPNDTSLYAIYYMDPNVDTSVNNSGGLISYSNAHIQLNGKTLYWTESGLDAD